jgi:predicted transposase YdaD
LKETNSEAVYVEQFAFGRTIHPYRVVRLWEQDPAPLLASPALLPLAVLAQTDSPEVLLEQVAEQIDMIEEPEQQQNISACVELLARLKFEKNFIQQFLREELMRESPLYQEILQEGVQQGLQQGLQQGKQEEAVAIVLRLLLRRLETVEPELQLRIQQLSSTQIEELAEALLDFSTKQDLLLWLETHRSPQEDELN